MNKEELKKADEAGVHPHYYSLSGLLGGPYDDTEILEREGNKWLVYHFERGSKWDLQYFETEDAACRYFLQKLIRSPITRCI